MPGDYEVIWEDETVWTFGWVPDAGSFYVDRWIPEEDDFPIDDIIDTPAPHICFVESLDVLEEAMGRPLPADIRAELQADADAYPISEERLASWSEWDGYEITRKTPEGEWLETFAPPGHPDPFARRWWADVDLYIRGLL
jgi:hypothetical protein